MNRKTFLGAAVFARTPGSGGKSRLAATWGRERTDRFYEHCLDCAADWLNSGSAHCQGYWAITGPGSRSTSFWRDGEILEQGEGSLGTRMHDIAEHLVSRHGRWCLVGTDIPQMPPLADLELEKLLLQNDYVFGPATDGGFWLVAGRCRIPRKIWEAVTYSQPETLAELTGKIQRADCTKTVTLLPCILTDIDRQDNLKALVNELDMIAAKLSPAQKALSAWLEKELSIANG